MGYVGSYVWSVRQKAGNLRLITATVDVIPIDPTGKVLMVKINDPNKPQDAERWAFVGGHVELGDTWGQAAAKELLEEGGLVSDPSDLISFAIGSGGVWQYPDGSTQSMTVLFICKKYTTAPTWTDKEEISETHWFTIEEAESLKKTSWSGYILSALKTHLATGNFQQIVMDADQNEKPPSGQETRAVI